ncbi:MAG: insulinase family protein [Cellvibrionaceae bacterium]|nr:insulinase family protein [Cellvibrionaceae bacterium]
MVHNAIKHARTFLLCGLISIGAHGASNKVTEVEGISEYRLDNGLQVLLFPDPSKETVTVNVTYHVGSKHENYGETGMAHLLEHLVFKGSPKHKDIPSELSAHGARPNGTTWTDRTNYFETFNASEKNIDWALSMESDRMVNSFIAKKDLDSEMTVVRNEFERSENSPFRVTLQKLMASAYAWHNYGKSSIGARSDIENVSIERLQAFYKKYYQPDNATLIVAGKFQPDTMLAKIEKTFGAIPKPERQLQALYTREPAQDGERLVTVRRVGDMQAYIAGYHVPAGSHPDYAAIDLLSSILGETPRGRLHKQLVEKKLASRTFGFGFQWAEPSLLMFAAQVDKSHDLNQASEALLKVVEQADDISQAELDRVKRKWSKNFELAFTRPEAIALELSEWVGMGDWRLLFLNRDRIEQVSLEDIKRVAKTYLQPNNRNAARFIPSEKPVRVEIPKAPALAQMLKDYKGREKIAAGELFDPSYDNIDKRTETYRIGDNLKVSLLPKKTRGQTVEVRLSFSIGDEKSLQNKRDIAATVGALLSRGSAGYTREQLQDKLDELKIAAGFSGSATGFNASISGKRDSLVQALELAVHVLKEPSFELKEFQQYQATQKVDLEENLQNPQALVFREYSRRHRNYEPTHPYYIPTYAESIENLAVVKHADLKTFHQQFYGASHGEISIIGDFDPAEVNRYWRNCWPIGRPHSAISALTGR